MQQSFSSLLVSRVSAPKPSGRCKRPISGGEYLIPIVRQDLGDALSRIPWHCRDQIIGYREFAKATLAVQCHPASITFISAANGAILHTTTDAYRVAWYPSRISGSAPLRARRISIKTRPAATAIITILDREHRGLGRAAQFGGNPPIVKHDPILEDFRVFASQCKKVEICDEILATICKHHGISLPWAPASHGIWSEKQKTAAEAAVESAPSGIRTPDTLIKSQLL